jgi:hypothetical protein
MRWQGGEGGKGISQADEIAQSTPSDLGISRTLFQFRTVSWNCLESSKQAKMTIHVRGKTDRRIALKPVSNVPKPGLEVEVFSWMTILSVLVTTRVYRVICFDRCDGGGKGVRVIQRVRSLDDPG